MEIDQFNIKGEFWRFHFTSRMLILQRHTFALVPNRAQSYISSNLTVNCESQNLDSELGGLGDLRVPFHVRAVSYICLIYSLAECV